MPLLPQRNKPKLPPKPETGTKQTIQARHGTATYVPKGHVIQVVNTYGKQVVDLWAFALHTVPSEDEVREDEEKFKEQSKKQGAGIKEKPKAKKQEEASGKGAEQKEKQPEVASKQKESEEKAGSKETKEDQKEDTKENEQSGSDKSSSKQLDKGEEEKQDPDKQEEAEHKTEISTPELVEKETSRSEEETESPQEKPQTPVKGWTSYIPNVRGRLTRGTPEKDAAQKESPEKSAQQESTPSKDATEEKTPEKPTEEKKTSDEPKAEKKTPRKLETKKTPAKKKDDPEGKEAKEDEEMSSSRTWGSYIPSFRGGKSQAPSGDDGQKEQRNWGSLIPSGKGFSSYISKDAVSSIAAMHQRDPDKSVAEQIYDFSKTPVGAAGLSIATGSGYASSIYAAYAAYNHGVTAKSDANAPGMEFLSMKHSRATIQHLSPRVGDTLVTNLRAPLLTLVEDTSPGSHDTLMAACDPLLYKELGVEKWAEHGSCAENLVLALQELNKQIGLKGARAIGGDVTVNNIPSPLNLFMNIPFTDKGDLSWEAPKGKRGDFVKFRAERDVVVVMSACPQDITEINAKKPMVAHFVVEGPSEEDKKATSERETKSKEVLEKAKKRSETEQKQRTVSRTTSQQSSAKPQPSRTTSNAKAPRKLSTTNSGSGKSTAQVSSPPKKETQTVESPPAKQQPTKTGRPRPKKLERRGTSSSSVPRPKQ